MTRRAVLIGTAAVVFALAAGALSVRASTSAAQIARGQEVYATQCARCHGANLEGQPDWQTRQPNGRMPAPPHDETGHTWHHPDQDLFLIVKEGIAAIVPGYETDMPAFGDLLSDQDLLAVLAFIKSTWPDRERQYQAARTAARAAEDAGR